MIRPISGLLVKRGSPEVRYFSIRTGYFNCELAGVVVPGDVALRIDCIGTELRFQIICNDIIPVVIKGEYDFVGYKCYGQKWQNAPYLLQRSHPGIRWNYNGKARSSRGGG